MKKLSTALLLLSASMLMACGGTNQTQSSKEEAKTEDTATSQTTPVKSEETQSSKNEEESEAPIASESESKEETPQTSVDIPEGYHGVTFHYNIGDNDVYAKVAVKDGLRVTLPTEPTYEGYAFDTWYTEKECENVFNTKTFVKEDIDLYAGWKKTSTFEAEYTDVASKQGFGYSGASGGVYMIESDKYEAGASNGYYVTYLYYKNAFVEFDIESDKEVDDAILTLRCSAQFYDMTFSTDDMSCEVNEEEIEYTTFSLKNTIGVDGDGLRPFDNHLMGKGIHLNKGTNKIVFTIWNSKGHGGTIYAEAPMFDCIYLSTDANLTWNPITSNLSRFNS